MNSSVVTPGRVLLVRHGQTEWNATQRWQGWADVALNGLGEQQARDAADTLVALLRDCTVRVVASDLQRAVHTAQTISEAMGTGPVEQFRDLRERNIGDWSGKTTSEIESLWPGQLEAWRDAKLERPPNGELDADVVTRTMRALRSLLHESVSNNSIVVAVSHGGVIRTVVKTCGGAGRAVGNLDAAWFAFTDDRVLQHVDAQHVDAQHVDAQHVDAQHVDAQHVDAQHVDAHYVGDVHHVGDVQLLLPEFRSSLGIITEVKHGPTVGTAL